MRNAGRGVSDLRAGAGAVVNRNVICGRMLRSEAMRRGRSSRVLSKFDLFMVQPYFRPENSAIGHAYSRRHGESTRAKYAGLLTRLWFRDRLVSKPLRWQ